MFYILVLLLQLLILWRSLGKPTKNFEYFNCSLFKFYLYFYIKSLDIMQTLQMKFLMSHNFYVVDVPQRTDLS